MGFYQDRGTAFEDAKNACGIEIESWYGSKVLDVFDSPSTGINRRYYCAESDQLRMLNGKVANTSITLMCGAVPADPEVAVNYEWVQHTSTEAGKTHTDYVQFSKAAATQYVGLKTELAAATTIQQVDAVMFQLWGV